MTLVPNIDSSRRGLRSALLRCATGLAGLVAAMAIGLPALSTPVAAADFGRIELGEPNTTAFVMSGQIVGGDLQKLQAETAKIAKGRRVVLILESPGGSVDEGIALGRYVYAERIATFVVAGPGCASACTFIFLAGRDLTTGNPMRTMVAGARLGFHQTRPANLEAGKTYTPQEVLAFTTGSQNAIRLIEAYFRDIKAEPQFLALTLSSPTQSLTFIGELEALRLGINLIDPSNQKLIRANTATEKVSLR